MSLKHRANSRRPSTRSGQDGFTLIELMVTMSIGAILAAVAVPQYSTYRGRSYDAHAELALRSASIAEEAYFVEAQTYASCNQTTCPGILEGMGFIHPGVVLQMNGTPSDFTGTSTHIQGTGKVYLWP